MSETLSGIGEFGMIARIEALVREEGRQARGAVLGIGDDCASFSARDGYELLVTCDAMVEGRHFLPSFVTRYEIGRRAMAMNISDIGAMGGIPLYALASLGLPRHATVDEIEELYRGFLRELNPLAAAIVGGNLTRSENDVFIDVTLIGEVEKGEILRRSTAQEGDAVLLTGFPGQAAAGLEILQKIASPRDDEGCRELVKAYVRPTHRAIEGRAIALSGCATAMIDVSDGLVGDLAHICSQSGAGVELHAENLPVSEALRAAAKGMNRNPLDWVLGASDDYELIVTCRPERVGRIRQAVAAVGDVLVSEIGRITDRSTGLVLVGANGKRSALSPRGWDHFAST